MAEFLLDTEAASRLMRAERSVVANMRQSGAKAVSISSITMAELVYGARLREHNPSIMSAVRAFLTRILIHAWDETAAEAHARIRLWLKDRQLVLRPVGVRQGGTSELPFDVSQVSNMTPLLFDATVYCDSRRDRSSVNDSPRRYQPL